MKQYNPRYARHYSLKDFGIEGQQKLAQAKILVVGAGGLGCPVLQYLVASGVGQIGIVDDDIVSLSNLQRQVLYSTEDIGRDKVTVAKDKLHQLNPEIKINSFKIRIDTSNALVLFADYDFIVDCTDNFASRYLINDACFLLKKPLIFGAIHQYEGQVAVFNVADANGNSTNYRNLFPIPPNPLEVSDCNEAGVLGVLPGIIGIFQATEVIKLLTGIGEVMVNKLMTFSILNHQSFMVEILINDSVTALIPKDEMSFQATDYHWLCGMGTYGIEEIDAAVFFEKIKIPNTAVIDVREVGELPKVDFETIHIPLSIFTENLPQIDSDTLILFCQSGKRSLKAAQLLYQQCGNSKKISHLKGGIIALQEIKNE